jgi:hypothetical protein
VNELVVDAERDRATPAKEEEGEVYVFSLMLYCCQREHWDEGHRLRSIRVCR